MPANLSLRPVTAEDKCFLRALFASSHERELAMVEWDREQRWVFIETQYQAQQEHYQKHFPRRKHLIVISNGKPIGMTAIDRSAREIRALDIIFTRSTTTPVSEQGHALNTIDSEGYAAAANTMLLKEHPYMVYVLLNSYSYGLNSEMENKTCLL